MNKKKTPILQALRQRGGTVYVFPSASEDVGLNLLSSTTGAALSHYALLRLPALTKEQLLCNYTLKHESADFDGNNYYAMSLLNYMMNFETLLTNQDNYNYQELSTVTEKVFWHWMNKIGAISFSNFEHADNSDIYHEKSSNKVVQCFGSIDAGNVLSSTFGMFNETYINIPSSYGDGPVYFTFSEDSNFPYSSTFVADPSTSLEGRANTKSISYTNQNDYPFCDSSNESSYVIPASLDGLTILKDLTLINKGLNELFPSSTQLVVNSYDDVNIDIDNKFQSGNDTVGDFEFNAVLLYYSVYDQDDAIKTPYAINLFGIIFLDGAEDVTKVNVINGTDTSANAYAIPTLTKNKSTAENFGNSYSFRVNMKSMSVYDNTDAVIQDDTTVSSILSLDMSDVISNLNLAIDVLNSNTRVISNIQNNYASILSYYDNQAGEIENISTALSAYLSGKRSSLIDTNVLKAKQILTKSLDDNLLEFYAYEKADALDTDSSQLKFVASVTENGLYSPESTFDNVINKTTYVDVKNSVMTTGDKDLSGSADGKQTVARIFGNYKDLRVKIVPANSMNDNGQIISTPNIVYIDPNSSIFDTLYTATTLASLITDNGEINYVGFIPYMIYKLQELTIDTYEKKGITKDEADKRYLRHMINTDYNSLISDMNKDALIPGQFYRITDYVTIISDSSAKSAGHLFDLIVRADSANKINDQAWAIQHIGDVYFASSNLNAWELKYDINNDTTKYAWANPVNGKGVIYYMKDEFGNECPYDFKNIMFTDFKRWNTIGTDSSVITDKSNWLYTFSSAAVQNCTDYSLNGFTNSVYKNVIKAARDTKLSLNKNIFIGSDCALNTIAEMSANNTFGSGCYLNNIGKGFINNIFGNSCQMNNFGDTVMDNVFHDAFTLNTLGNFCTNNIFNNICVCNILGTGCIYNIFYDECTGNKLGNVCNHNIFGTGYRYNTYESGCEHINISNGQTTVPYIKNIHIMEESSYIDLIYTKTTSSNAYLQNIQVALGCSGTSSQHKQITISKDAGDTNFTTIKPRNSEEILVD